MIELYLASFLLIITHLLPVIGPVRSVCMTVLGKRLYFTLYSTLSTASLLWLAWAYNAAPFIELWQQQPWMRFIPFLTMPLVCYLWVSGLTSPNPFSLTLSTKKFNANKPGIVAISHHPVVTGFILWALSHIPVNNDQAALTLFSAVILISLLGCFTLHHRKQTTIGNQAWHDLTVAIRSTSPYKGFQQTGILRFIASILLYSLLLMAHQWVIGVSPFPNF